MPRKCVLPENDARDVFLVIWNNPNDSNMIECIGLRSAITTYRQMRSVYGDNVRLARVVLSYGTEV